MSKNQKQCSTQNHPIEEWRGESWENQKLYWEIKLETLQQLAYMMVRSDMKGDHPEGTNVLDVVFKEIEHIILSQLGRIQHMEANTINAKERERMVNLPSKQLFKTRKSNNYFKY